MFVMEKEINVVVTSGDMLMKPRQTKFYGGTLNEISFLDNLIGLDVSFFIC